MSGKASGPLVSVIVPFYNIEGCVRYCLESLLNQTFDDYEVVCVDDGSTDRTGELLDLYAQADERVRVLHKENGGISDARNHGVSHARGDYISFVDGDDVVAPHYLATLYGVLGEDASNVMAISGIRTISEKRASSRLDWPQWDGSWICISQQEAARQVIMKNIATTAYGKMATRAFYETHPFDVAVRYDEALIASVILGIGQFRVAKCATYGYVMHPDSMIRSTATNEEALDYADAIQTGKEAFLREYPDLKEQIAYWDAIYAARFHATVGKMDSPDPALGELDAQMRKIAKKRASAIALNGELGTAKRLRVLLYLFAPFVHDKAISIYNRTFKGID